MRSEIHVLTEKTTDMEESKLIETASQIIPDSSGIRVTVGDADFPAPFLNGLEFNAPVHETWNIVHMGMLVPDAHQIYICADNCMRGVVMTAAEMDAIDRFSCVVLQEHDLYDGNLEEITLEGVTDVIRKLRRHNRKQCGDGEQRYPRAVLIFPVCLHHFMGCDMNYVYRQLEKRFPDIDFIRCWMDPIMQKSGPSPAQKEYMAVMDMLVKHGTGGMTRAAALLGDNLPLDPDSELMRIIERGCGGQEKGVIQIQDCKTYDQFLSLGESSVMITRNPAAETAVRMTACRTGRKFLYLPPVFGYRQIAEQILRAENAILHADDRISASDTGDIMSRYKRHIEKCEASLDETRAAVGDVPVAIDYIAVPRPLGLARLLLEHRFNVREIYLDAISAEEAEDFRWLQENAPKLELCCTNHVKGRLLHGGVLRGHGRYLAIGPKAAWFCGTGHFVNLVDFGGMWGFTGICKLAGLMKDAYEKEKDTRSIVPRKGLGCECIL